MKKLLTFLILIVGLGCNAQELLQGKENFKKRIIANGLIDPWSLEIDGEGFLWITESKAYTVSRIDPKTGEKIVLLDLNDQKDFEKGEKTPWPQGGLMGLALHPNLLTDKPFVYLAYVYTYLGNNTFKTKLVRYRYNKDKNRLERPEIISDDIPGSNDHNGGRLLLAKIDAMSPYFLFYSIGDMGAGQYQNGSRTNHAQDITSYEGKILRFNSEPINNWIPADNPYISKGGKAIWTLGHRNPQGLCKAELGGNNFIFSSEHGPLSDDEINIINKGQNYGHPLIIGFADGNYNGLAAGVSDNEDLPGFWNTSYPFIESEQKNMLKIGGKYQDPLITFYPTPQKQLQSLFEKSKQGTDAQWRSEAPSSIAFYNHSAIPNWKNSLLVPALKGGKLIRIPLDNSGTKVSGKAYSYFEDQLRYRDVKTSADGMKLYMITDRSKATSGPSKTNKQDKEMGGSLIEFEYLP